jgi:hypothetical protein
MIGISVKMHNASTVSQTSSNIGLSIEYNVDSSGNMPQNYGILLNTPTFGSTGTIGTHYGIFINSQGPTGVTTPYGLYINGQGSSGIPIYIAAQTSPWSIYSAGQGKFFIGDTTASTATSSGSLVTGGGIGAGGSIFAGKAIVSNVVTTYNHTSGSTVTIDCSTGNSFLINLNNGNATTPTFTFGTPSSPYIGQTINIVFKQPATNPVLQANMTWPANTVMIWAGGGKATAISQTASSYSMISMVYVTGNFWLVTNAKDFA